MAQRSPKNDPPRGMREPVIRESSTDLRSGMLDVIVRFVGLRVRNRRRAAYAKPDVRSGGGQASDGSLSVESIE